MMPFIVQQQVKLVNSEYFNKNLFQPFTICTTCEFVLFGGGGHFHIICVLGMSRARPPFSSLNFRSRVYHFQSISPFFSCKADFTFFAAPETVIFKISSRSSHWFIAAHGRLTAAKRSGSAPGLAAGQSASQTRPTSQLRRPPFRSAPPPPRCYLYYRHFQCNFLRLKNCGITED